MRGDHKRARRLNVEAHFDDHDARRAAKTRKFATCDNFVGACAQIESNFDCNLQILIETTQRARRTNFDITFVKQIFERMNAEPLEAFGRANNRNAAPLVQML